MDAGARDGVGTDWRALRLFVSHSHADNAFGLRLVADLRRILGSAESVWYDAAGGLQGGDAWWRTIREELTSRPVCLVLVSPASMDSIWVNNEIDMAWAQRNAHRDAHGRPAGKRILPLLIAPATLRADLATLAEDTVSFLPPASYAASLRALLDRLGIPPGAEDVAPALPRVPSPATVPSSEIATAEDSLTLRREPLTPRAKGGISRRTVLALGGTVAAAAVVGGFADLLLTHGAGGQRPLGAKPTATASGAPKSGSRVRWQTDAGVFPRGFHSQLVATAGGKTLCFGTRTGAYALDATTGAKKWEYTQAREASPYETYSTLATNEIVVLGGYTSQTFPATTIYSLHSSDGSVAWQRGTQAAPLALMGYTLPPQPTVIYAQQQQTAADDSTQALGVEALRASDGAILAEMGRQMLATEPLIGGGWWASNGDILMGPNVGDYAGSGWYAFDATTLQPRWVVTRNPGTADFLKIWEFILVGEIGFCLTGDGYLTAVRAADASLIWERLVVSDVGNAYPPGSGSASNFAALLTSGKVLIVVISDGRIYALDMASGSVIWRATPTKDSEQTWALQGVPAIDGKHLYVPGQNNAIYALDLQHGGETRWVVPLANGFACAPVVAGGLVSVADGAGTIYGYATD